MKYQDAFPLAKTRVLRLKSEAPWSSEIVNERRLQVMGKCNQISLNAPVTTNSLGYKPHLAIA